MSTRSKKRGRNGNRKPGKPSKFNNRRSNKNNNKKNKKRESSIQVNYNNRRHPTFTQQEGIVDYLCEDEEINSQRYGCISFASITDDMKDEICQQIAGQLSVTVDNVKSIVNEWCTRENPKRAVKVRGTFKTLEQTYRKAEQLRNADANFHIFTCEVGKWLPFDPPAELLEDENYMEDQLNQLLKGYKQNRVNTKQHYDERKREMMEKAIQEGTPEGQQVLMDAAEPYEAVKFKAEQAEDTIEQLQTRIKELTKTKEM